MDVGHPTTTPDDDAGARGRRRRRRNGEGNDDDDDDDDAKVGRAWGVVEREGEKRVMRLVRCAIARDREAREGRRRDGNRAGCHARRAHILVWVLFGGAFW